MYFVVSFNWLIKIGCSEWIGRLESPTESLQDYAKEARKNLKRLREIENDKKKSDLFFSHAMCSIVWFCLVRPYNFPETSPDALQSVHEEPMCLREFTCNR